jgi:hypothetical protein
MSRVALVYVDVCVYHNTETESGGESVHVWLVNCRTVHTRHGLARYFTVA